jgi:hypothetical protein
MCAVARRVLESPRVDEVAVTVAWAAAAGGALVRLQQFAARRSLWADEAALAVNVVQRDFAGLLEPLDGNQGAPVLFLFVQRVMVLVGGNNEFALRLLPLAAGIALLPLVYLTARRMADPVVAAGATTLVAFSSSLVRYSTEVKQYSTDAAIAVGMLLLASWAASAPTRRERWAVLGAAGAVAVWSSHPAVFVLAGIGSVLAIRAARRRDHRQTAVLAAVGTAWLASISVLYLVSLRRLEQNEFLTDFWQDGFPPRPLAVGSTMRWLAESGVAAMESPVGLFPPAIALIACVVGLAIFVQRDQLGVALMVGFAPFLLVAAFAERYPVRGRLLLFAVPIVLIALAAVVVPGRWRLAGIALVVVLAGGNLIDVARVVADPPEFAESRPAFQHVGEQQIDGDELWIHDVTVEPYRYYGPIVGIDADRRSRWSPDGPCAVEASGRVWVVFAYTLSTRPSDEADRLRDHLAGHAVLVGERRYQDAAVWLFDFDAAPGATPRLDPELGCVVTSPEAPVARSGLSTGPFGTGATS